MSFFDRVATAPISWGICEVPGWGHQLDVERVLAEMSSLGFTQTELGSLGWLPTDPAELTATLGAANLGLLAGFVPLVLHDSAEQQAAEKAAIEAADLLSAAGAEYYNTAPVMSWDWAPHQTLNEAEWVRLTAGLQMVEDICADRGLTQVVHEHVGIAVETEEDVQRLLDSSPVKFVLDTAHLALGGTDPLQFAVNNADRVGLVHLKDMSAPLAEAFTTSQSSDDPIALMTSVQDGLFPALGEGDLPIAEVIRTLEDAGFDGWYVIEQDCAITGEMPGEGEGPVRDVATSVSFVQGLSIL